MDYRNCNLDGEPESSVDTGATQLPKVTLQLKHCMHNATIHKCYHYSGTYVAIFKHHLLTVHMHYCIQETDSVKHAMIDESKHWFSVGMVD